MPPMAVGVLESLRAARGWLNYLPGPPFDFLAGARGTQSRGVPMATFGAGAACFAVGGGS